MIGHENIAHVTRLTASASGMGSERNLWGAVAVGSQYGIAVEGAIEHLRDDQRSFSTRPYKLYEAEPGTLKFIPGTKEPEGTDIRALALSGPDVRTRTTFRHFPSGIVAVDYSMVAVGSDNVFTVRRDERAEGTRPLPPNSLNGNLPDFQDEMIAANAGTYLDLVLNSMRIAAHFRVQIDGLVPVQTAEMA